MDIRTYTNINDLKDFWPKNENVVTPFQTFTWQRLWIKHFLEKKRLQIITFWGKKLLLAIFPFFQTDNSFQLTGTPPSISDYLDIIWLTPDLQTQSEAFHAFLNYLPTIYQFDNLTITFSHLPENSPTIEIIRSLPFNYDIRKESVPYLTCPASWRNYLESLNQKSRHELKRKLHRLSEIPYQILYFVSPQKIKNSFPDFIHLHKLSHQSNSLLLNQSVQDFLHELVWEMAKENLVLLSFLEIKGNQVASALYFAHRQKLLMYNSGFDPQWKHLSPGILLKALNLQYAIQKGFTGFDFLRGGERYKYQLGADNRYIYNIKIKMQRSKIKMTNQNVKF